MTNEEIATRYLFVDMAIKNMQLDLQHIQNGPQKIKQPYIVMVEKLISKGMKERRILKKLMYEEKIRVEFQFSQGDFSTYFFYIGNEKRIKTYNRSIIKRNVEEIMMELIKEGQH